MKIARLFLLAFALVGLGACQSDVLAPSPTAETEGYAGSGSQMSPADGPSLNEGYAGSGS